MAECARTLLEVMNVCVLLALLVSVVRSILMNVILLSALQTRNVSTALGPTSVCAKRDTQVCFCLNIRPSVS
jgi:hypothetical protein